MVTYFSVSTLITRLELVSNLSELYPYIYHFKGKSTEENPICFGNTPCGSRCLTFLVVFPLSFYVHRGNPERDSHLTLLILP